MTKQYFEKELTFNNEKKAHEYNEKIAAIKAEVAQLKIKKEEAKTKVPELKEQITTLVTDVEVVTNAIKRKSALKKKRELQEELDEWELFAGMNIEAYETKCYEELAELGHEAKKEKELYEKKVYELKNEMERVHKEQMAEINQALNNRHPFYRYAKEYEKGNLRTLQERQRLQSIEHAKKFNRQPLYKGGLEIGYIEPEYNDKGEKVGQNIHYYKQAKD